WEGRAVVVTTMVAIEKGKAGRLLLKRDDGVVIASSDPDGVHETSVTNPSGVNFEVRRLTLAVKGPTDGKGYGHTDAAHNYRVELSLPPGAKLHIFGAVIQKG